MVHISKKEKTNSLQLVWEVQIRIGKIHESDRLLQLCDTFQINGPIQYL